MSGIAGMGALSAVGALPTPPPPGVPQRLGMHEAGGLSAVGPMRGRPGCLLPGPWGAPWDTRSDDPGPLPPGAGRPPHRTCPAGRGGGRSLLCPSGSGAEQPSRLPGGAGAAGGGCRCRPAVGGAHPRSRGRGVHRTVGWCCAGDVEHPAGGGAGVGVLVPGKMATRCGSARRGGSPPPAHRPHPCGPLPGP